MTGSVISWSKKLPYDLLGFRIDCEKQEGDGRVEGRHCCSHSQDWRPQTRHHAIPHSEVEVSPGSVSDKSRYMDMDDARLLPPPPPPPLLPPRSSDGGGNDLDRLGLLLLVWCCWAAAAAAAAAAALACSTALTPPADFLGPYPKNERKIKYSTSWARIPWGDGEEPVDAVDELLTLASFRFILPRKEASSDVGLCDNGCNGLLHVGRRLLLGSGENVVGGLSPILTLDTYLQPLVGVSECRRAANAAATVLFGRSSVCVSTECLLAITPAPLLLLPPRLGDADADTLPECAFLRASGTGSPDLAGEFILAVRLVRVSSYDGGRHADDPLEHTLPLVRVEELSVDLTVLVLPVRLMFTSALPVLPPHMMAPPKCAAICTHDDEDVEEDGDVVNSLPRELERDTWPQLSSSLSHDLSVLRTTRPEFGSGTVSRLNLLISSQMVRRPRPVHRGCRGCVFNHDPVLHCNVLFSPPEWPELVLSFSSSSGVYNCVSDMVSPESRLKFVKLILSLRGNGLGSSPINSRSSESPWPECRLSDSSAPESCRLPPNGASPNNCSVSWPNNSAQRSIISSTRDGTRREVSGPMARAAATALPEPASGEPLDCMALAGHRRLGPTHTARLEADIWFWADLRAMWCSTQRKCCSSVTFSLGSLENNLNHKKKERIISISIPNAPNVFLRISIIQALGNCQPLVEQIRTQQAIGQGSQKVLQQCRNRQNWHLFPIDPVRVRVQLLPQFPHLPRIGRLAENPRRKMRTMTGLGTVSVSHNLARGWPKRRPPGNGAMALAGPAPSVESSFVSDRLNILCIRIGDL
ncbi:unnamed protein product [Notodromas monacha]|uniref:Uncharacterized protein n=1 Tax=Notodromas monacha TaxID=399045 RepID=A0A7R9BHE1_9CRUS|nr:unnamed protein product [Notodromas monacha]CAG0915274.1 unnamed protein product [Notodromas monacha]